MRGFGAEHEAAGRSMREEAVRTVLVAEGRDISRVAGTRMRPGESCEAFCNRLRQHCRIRNVGLHIRPRALGLVVQPVVDVVYWLARLVAGAFSLCRSTERSGRSRIE